MKIYHLRCAMILRKQIGCFFFTGYADDAHFTTCVAFLSACGKYITQVLFGAGVVIIRVNGIITTTTVFPLPSKFSKFFARTAFGCSPKKLVVRHTDDPEELAGRLVFFGECWISLHLRPLQPMNYTKNILDLMACSRKVTQKYFELRDSF